MVEFGDTQSHEELAQNQCLILPKKGLCSYLYRHLEDLHCAYGTDSGTCKPASCHGKKTLERISSKGRGYRGFHEGLVDPVALEL